MQSNERLICPVCHCEDKSNFCREGFKQLFRRRVQRYRCKCCGHVFHLEVKK